MKSPDSPSVRSSPPSLHTLTNPASRVLNPAWCNPMLLLTFTAGANRYAVDVARVVEVVPRVELRKIPHAPAFLAGLLGYRGKVVPVIDLGLLLDVAPCRDCLSTRIILVNDSPDDHNRRNQNRDDFA